MFERDLSLSEEGNNEVSYSIVEHNVAAAISVILPSRWHQALVSISSQKRYRLLVTLSQGFVATQIFVD